ncbi:hypothetical protein D3C81_1747330 [compost metagenome]
MEPSVIPSLIPISRFSMPMLTISKISNSRLFRAPKMALPCSGEAAVGVFVVGTLPSTLSNKLLANASAGSPSSFAA